MTEMTSHKRTFRHAVATAPGSRNRPWPLVIIAAPAAVAIWSGWVGLGGMCGFGPVNLLPGIGGGFHLNTAITLPVGIESYGAYALSVWLGGHASDRTELFARRSAIGALVLGCFGQVAYHLLAAARWALAPWPVVVAVSCLPVITLFFAATLMHLKRADAGTAPEAMLEPQSAAAVSPIEPAPEPVVPADTEGDTAVPDTAVQAPRRKAGTTGRQPARKRPAKAAPASAIPNDVDTQAEALRILAANPDIDGSELGRQLGKTPGYGRTLKRKLAGSVAGPDSS